MLLSRNIRFDPGATPTPIRCTRRTLISGVLGSLIPGGVALSTARAEEHIEQPSLAEVPTMGGRRAGPIEPAVSDQAAAVAPGPERQPDVPVAIQIEAAGVDAPIERVGIIDGVMQNPSGPWVVAWYEDLAALGEGSNVVMAGHVDYWNVGPAVFWNLSQLVPGDVIRVIGEGGLVVDYAVDWLRNYVVADMTPADIEEVVGVTARECLTLITCSIGSWDPVTQQYLERMALRATEIA